MESSKSFEEKFMRICEVAQTDKDTVLAKILGIKAPSVAAARKRQQIPTGWVEKIALKFDVSADWIFFGRGPMRPGEGTPEPAPQAETQRCTPDTAMLERELGEERRERRALAEENRRLTEDLRLLTRENRTLWEDNGKLREENGIMRERLNPSDGAGKVGSNVA